MAAIAVDSRSGSRGVGKAAVSVYGDKMDNGLSAERIDDVRELLREGQQRLERDPEQAEAKARMALAAAPGNADAYRLLGAASRRLGRSEEAHRAEMAAIEASAADPDLCRAGDALLMGDLAPAEATLRAILDQRPNDVAAIRMLGEVAAAVGLVHDAEALFRQALELAPGFDYARLHLADALYQQLRNEEALAELDKVGGEFAQYPETKALRAAALGLVGEYQAAIDLYREIVAADPRNLDAWTSLAFLLKTVGKPGEAAEACRAALNVAPADGEAWWMLADLKTYAFSDSDMAQLTAAIADPKTGEDDRLRLHMTLAKALEDRGEVDASFDHYRQGNGIRAAQYRHEPARTARLVDRMEALFTAEFLELRRGGNPAPDPIFVVGMPRSGSTLVEQILASHPAIEGTAELTDIHVVARSLELRPRYRGEWESYPEILADLPADRLAELGGEYLERTRIQRKTDRPLFVDKMPNNWMHVGFIQLILPNAKIIDARRHPLACGFSNFKQLYARGQEFSYDLAHFGQQYRQYARLMAHFDRVAPGRILRVIHESLVADPALEIRRMLDYVGVPFDEGCLRFHETPRPVRTASAEQVRRPIQAEATEQWRVYERHLGPLKAALGPLVDDWRAP